MWDLKACIVCFRTSGNLFTIENGSLRYEFFLLSGIEDKDVQGLPHYLCVECSAYVRRYKKFRDKCHRAHFTLKQVLKKSKEIKTSHLELLDCNQIDVKPTLSYADLNKFHYEEVKFQWVKQNRISVMECNTIPVSHYTTIALEEEFEVPTKKIRLSDSINGNIVKVETDEFSENLDIDFSLNTSKEQNFIQQSTSTVNIETAVDIFFDNDFDSDNGDELDSCENVPLKREKDDDNVDGSNLNEEYASMIPITEKEAKTVVEVYKMFNNLGNYVCKVCSKSFYNENRYKIHLRMHDQHVSGNFLCGLCHFYYKTEFLLKTHMTEKHLYKYVCRKCPEVSFDRISAKQHFIWTHLQKGAKKHANWYESRPTWLGSRGGKRVKGTVSLRPVKKKIKLPADFLVYSPVTQEEQYQLVQERRQTRNYIDALYKCEYCFRGFREVATFSKHMKKHDPEYSGQMQCDMCKLQFRDARKLYKHMNITHLFKYSCQMCTYVCYNRGQAQMHYRWHKNVTYDCPHCDKEFKKASTRLTHIRIKHPSTNICNLCGHSFVSETGLYCHKKLAHSKEEIELSEAAEVSTEDLFYCAECKVRFMSEAAYKTHLGSSNKHASINVSSKPQRGTRTGERKKRGRPRNGSSDIVNNGMPTSTHCDVCGKFLCNDVQARKHYESEHPGAEFPKRYMCDVCGHTTRQYANLMVHMRTHTNEKPYTCPHCDRRFSMPSNRDRHLVVHTGEKRYQCQHCNRRFTQSSAVKLHIQTVHLKIPYAPWDKKNRKRRKELEGTSVAAQAASATTALSMQPPQPKLMLESHGDYLNAYITYNDE